MVALPSAVHCLQCSLPILPSPKRKLSALLSRKVGVTQRNELGERIWDPMAFETNF
jgi:hypothetical protein